MIALNWTILVTGAAFLFTLWALNRFLFRPIFQVLEQRESLTRETEREAAEKLKYRNALYEQYSEKVKQEKQKGYQLAESVRRDSLSQRQSKLAAARARAEERLVGAQAEVEQEAASARNKLRREAEDLADQITSQILEEASSR